MLIENFVILIMCTRASLDDLIHEQQRHKAVAVAIRQYEKHFDYMNYRDQFGSDSPNDINLLFIFGINDSILVKGHTEMAQLQERLDRGDC